MTYRTSALTFSFILIFHACQSDKIAPTDPEQDPLILTTPWWRTEPFGSVENLGEQTTVVILVRFADMMEITRPAQIYQDAIFDAPNSVNAYVQEVSYGKAWLTGEVYGWYELDEESPCNQETLTESIMHATKDEIDFSKFRRIVIITPQIASGVCSPPYPAGNGTIGTVTLETEQGPIQASIMHIIWEGYINLNLKPAARTLTHELMHNFGMWHANAYNCGGESINSDQTFCQSLEYGNKFSILGTANHAMHINAFAKEWIGWLPEGEILTATGNGRYVIYPLELAGSEAKAIRIPLQNPMKVVTRGRGEVQTANEYYVEFRQPIGFDALDKSDDSVESVALDGVLLYTWTRRNNHINYFNSDDQIITLLIDSTPESQTQESTQQGIDDFSDALLELGQTFYDRDNGIRITPYKLREDGGIEVHVNFDEK